MTDENKELLYKLAVAEERFKDLSKDYEKERAENKMRRLVLQGMVAEHFHLNISVSPEIVNGDVLRLAQLLLQNYVMRTVREIEDRIGWPGRTLQEALMHIHYLENWALHNGLKFTQWQWKEKDRGLLY